MGSLFGLPLQHASTVACASSTTKGPRKKQQTQNQTFGTMTEHGPKAQSQKATGWLWARDIRYICFHSGGPDSKSRIGKRVGFYRPRPSPGAAGHRQNEGLRLGPAGPRAARGPPERTTEQWRVWQWVPKHSHKMRQWRLAMGLGQMDSLWSNP